MHILIITWLLNKPNTSDKIILLKIASALGTRFQLFNGELSLEFPYGLNVLPFLKTTLIKLLYEILIKQVAQFRYPTLSIRWKLL